MDSLTYSEFQTKVYLQSQALMTMEGLDSSEAYAKALYLLADQYSLSTDTQDILWEDVFLESPESESHFSISPDHLISSESFVLPDYVSRWYH